MKNLVVFLSGKQGSGKTTLATGIFNHFLNSDSVWLYNMKFADPLYEMHRAVFNVLENYGVPVPEKIDGNLLQLLGTEWGRQTRGMDFWVDIARWRVSKLTEKPALWPKHRILLIDDARFPNEIDFMDKAPGVETLKIRLEAAEHIRRVRAEKWREAVTHPSEIMLDDYPRFDKIIFTDKHMENETLGLAIRAIEERLNAKTLCN